LQVFAGRLSPVNRSYCAQNAAKSSAAMQYDDKKAYIYDGSLNFIECGVAS
jgi:hypothetical protein